MKEKETNEKIHAFMISSIFVFIISSIILFATHYILFGIALIALTILQIVFNIFRKKINPILYSIIFAISIMVFITIVLLVFLLIEGVINI